MDKYAKAFVKASMIYLGIGTLMGGWMVLSPDIRFALTQGSHPHSSSGIYGNDDLRRRIPYSPPIYGKARLQSSSR